MEVCDYSRSFVTFVGHERSNNARLQVESVTKLTDTEAGTSTDYCFFASCKSEDTFAKKNLFYEDNYDFCGIFSADEYAIFRTCSTHTEEFREQGAWRGRFEDVHWHIVRSEGTELTEAVQIVRASLENVPLVGKVEIASADGALGAEIEFPIKTMNANDLKDIYQVDTGPLAFPDFEMAAGRHIERAVPGLRGVQRAELRRLRRAGAAPHRHREPRGGQGDPLREAGEPAGEDARDRRGVRPGGPAADRLDDACSLLALA